MAGKGKAVGAAIKYGPLVYAAAQRYAPQVWEQVRAQREPAERYMHDRVAKGNHRKRALEHARTVLAGSVLQVFHHNRAHWIVFSGEEPIATHPPTSAPYDVLLEHADLSTRVRPGHSMRLPTLSRPTRASRSGAASSSRPRRGGSDSSGQRPAPTTVTYHQEPADGPPRPGPGEGQRPTA